MKNCAFLVPQCKSTMLKQEFQQFPLTKIETFEELTGIGEKMKIPEDTNDQKKEFLKKQISDEGMKAIEKGLKPPRNLRTYWSLAALNQVKKLQDNLGKSMVKILNHPHFWKSRERFQMEETQKEWEAIIRKADQALIQEYIALHKKEAKKSFQGIADLCVSYAHILERAEATSFDFTKQLAIEEYNEAVELMTNSYHTSFVSALEGLEEIEEEIKKDEKLSNASFIITTEMAKLAKKKENEKEIKTPVGKKKMNIPHYPRNGRGRGRGRNNFRGRYRGRGRSRGNYYNQGYNYNRNGW